MKRDQRGMTLVEVVIASTVLSLLMLALSTALYSFAGTLSSVEGAVGNAQRMREVDGFLRDSLESAIFSSPQDFIFEADKVVWLTPTDRIAASEGISWFRLKLQSKQLVLDLASVEVGDQRQEPEPAWGETIKTQILLEDVEKFAVSVLYRADQGWVTSNSEVNGALPQLLRLEFDLREGTWPPVVIAFREAGPPQS